MGHQLPHVSIYSVTSDSIKVLTIRSEVIDEIQIICPEIHAAEWRSWRDGKARGPTTCQGGIEVRGHGQGAGEGIIQTSHGDCSPYYVNGIARLVRGVCGLAQKIGGTTSGDVYLVAFRIDERGD